MKKNIGSIDKMFRLLVAIVVAVLYFTDQITGTTAIVLLAVGAILALTSLIGTCPIYMALGISSNKKK